MDLRIDVNEEKWDKKILEILLLDRTTNKNIIWATNDYENMGNLYHCKQSIEYHLITGENKNVIQPRVLKSEKNKKSRTKQRAEVFTPSWVCNAQSNLVDKYWFEREDVFNIEKDKKWVSTTEKIKFPKDKTWQMYVEENRLEITCGEAPYLVSRYDAVSGEYIELSQRIGLLDRKLRIVNENTENEKEWLEWTKIAYQSIYGFELQGDSLLIARENLLATFSDNIQFKLNRQPTEKELIDIASIISWNLWQMDGLTYKIPYDTEGNYCLLKDWKENKVVRFKDLLNKEGI